MKSSHVSTGPVFILFVEYILKERNNILFLNELMDSLRTVSKQPATLCVIQMSAESIFVVFLKGKNTILFY